VYGGGGFRADRQLHSPTRQRLRQEEARPILEQLQSYLRKQQPAALPKSPLGAARLRAAQLGRPDALRRKRQLKIDNNGTQQALRPIVLGQRLAVRGERSGGAPNRDSVFAHADVSARCSARPQRFTPTAWPGVCAGPLRLGDRFARSGSVGGIHRLRIRRKSSENRGKTLILAWRPTQSNKKGALEPSWAVGRKRHGRMVHQAGCFTGTLRSSTRLEC